MINAKEELLKMLKLVNQMYGANVICANIDYDGKLIELNKGYTEKQFNSFLSKLNFEYHNGYGAQRLFGKVWLTNGVWLDRGEYDGSEWWEYYKYPELPTDVIINESLKNLNL